MRQSGQLVVSLGHSRDPQRLHAKGMHEALRENETRVNKKVSGQSKYDNWISWISWAQVAASSIPSVS